MWISYCPLDHLDSRLDGLTRFTGHHLLAVPKEPWQALKIGGGTPPVRTQHGWLTIFHGVGIQRQKERPAPCICYAAGALVLDEQDPRKVLYRSSRPILEPEIREELDGMMPHVVFPTAIDAREDGRVDVYYGMADSRIGVGRLLVPQTIDIEDEGGLAA
jgi:predicted GH43/DUF377 family glycosyl hydrolase